MDYEQKLEDFYKKLDLEGQTIVDVGAHTGRHTLPLARLAGVAGVVYAFEPIPQIRLNLSENIISNELNNVVIFPFALSNKRGVSDFIYVPNLPEESGLKERKIYNGKPTGVRVLKVSIIKLDDLITSKNKIGFIKIDVEGGELDVIQGAKSTLIKSRPIVTFECGASSFLGYHNSPEKIFHLFIKMDYSIYSILGNEIIDEETFVEACHAQIYWDYIALPSEKKWAANLI
jgi:FkbM family methyltransferase